MSLSNKTSKKRQALFQPRFKNSILFTGHDSGKNMVSGFKLITTFLLKPAKI